MTDDDDEVIDLYKSSHMNDSMVVLSDVNLDRPEVCECSRTFHDNQVMARLNELFQGYAESPPIMFIVCGPFSSSPSLPLEAYARNFTELARMISTSDIKACCL